MTEYAKWFPQSRSSGSQIFCKIGALKDWAIFTGKHLCWSLFFIKLQVFSPATLLKRDSNTVVFLWILWNFYWIIFIESLFHKITLLAASTAQKIKISIKNFFSKCDQILGFRRIWSHLLKKFSMENFIFCAVFWRNHFPLGCCIHHIRPWDYPENFGIYSQLGRKSKTLFFYLPQCICFLNPTGQNPNLTAFTCKIQVFCRPEWNKGGTPWKWISAIFKCKKWVS